MTTTINRAALTRNEHLTFRANMGVGRHGWLRLTPAYGVRLVRERLEALEPGAVVTDPFSVSRPLHSVRTFCESSVSI